MSWFKPRPHGAMFSSIHKYLDSIYKSAFRPDGSSILGVWNHFLFKPGPRVDKSENNTLAFDVITPCLAPSQTPLRYSNNNTNKHWMIVFLLTNINAELFHGHFLVVVFGLYTARKVCAHAKSSSLFLLNLCGIITAPHAGLACILHRFVSVS